MFEDDFDPDSWPPRPIANTDLRGHDEGESTLLDAFNSGRLHHAWLITGPKGIGKATLAHRFARFVLTHGKKDDGPGLFGEALPAEDPTSLNVSKESLVYQRIVAGGHADMLVIERRINEKTGKLKSVIDVDSVREVGSFLRLTPAEGGYRVVVIDSADEMNANSANAVLKVLEEPPKNALLILVSHNPGRLLPTIRSRCRKLALRPLEPQLVSELVRTYAPQVSAEDGAHLASLSDGSIGRALGLVEEGGLELYSDLLALLHSLPNIDIQALHTLADRVGRAGAEDAFFTVTGLLRWWMERMILIAAGKAPTTSGMNDDEALFMAGLASQASLERWFLVWEKINHLVARTDSLNLDRKQIILDAFLGLENTVRQG
ncbi:MAG: DNA polymerase III subunit delta' [Magnetovibrio sp.]|nr:DNA polymerase III subunit delta' [Magnetovibrio sp.]